MIDVVRETIEAETALLTQEQDPSNAQLDYGKDIACDFDVDANWSELDADDPQVVINASVRRLITERGSNPDDPNYGLNVVAYLSRPLKAVDIAELEGLAKLELQKDDRVLLATVRAELTDLKTMALFVRLELNNPRVKVPSFTLRLTTSTIALELAST
jgi:hypothetical protein